MKTIRKIYRNSLRFSKKLYFSTYTRRAVLGVCILIAVWFSFCLPSVLFDDPISTAIYSKDGRLLNAHIAKDGQWRFAELDSVPMRFEAAIICYEDKRFSSHYGVDFLAVGRAIHSNVSQRKVVSGASTITMQLMRMSRKAGSRSIFQKAIESAQAIRAELRYSKEEILNMYASHAPFGGNVVGLESAAWRYFGRSPFQLSWAESATLAVLPNQPSMIHPGRNREVLESKRNALLLDLWHQGIIDEVEYRSALLEAVPVIPKVLPRKAPHLMNYAKNNGSEDRLRTTVDFDIQTKAQQVVDQHYQTNVQNDIHNAAVLIIHNETGEVISYIGNTRSGSHEGSVDMVQSERSSGSILKPLLYASMIDDRMLTPQMLVNDIPSYINGYTPKNYHKRFSGAVSASVALSRSLNVPAVLQLQEYGVERFLQKLKHYGISTLDYSSDHYGLPLILGGAEVSLWDLCNVYSSMARTLDHYYHCNNKYDVKDWRSSTFIESDNSKGSFTYSPSHLSASSIYSTFEAMQNLSRPSESGHWEQFSSSRKVAWKTGTSYGHRDAWAIGCTKDYTIGIWAGNADGEGRPGIVGVHRAGSILFDILNILPREDRWFYEPLDEMITSSICESSGHLAGPHCIEVDSIRIPIGSAETSPCPYHRRIHLDRSKQYQVNAHCVDRTEMYTTSWFVLPPQVSTYYRQSHADYRELPTMHPSCNHSAPSLSSPIDLVYPFDNASIYIPTDIAGHRQQTIAKAVHQDENSILYWHLDGEYLGSTEVFHTMAIDTDMGDHSLLLVDENGYSVSKQFEVLSE